VSGPSEYSDGGVVQYQLNDGKTAMSAGCETVRELRCARSAQWSKERPALWKAHFCTRSIPPVVAPSLSMLIDWKRNSWVRGVLQPQAGQRPTVMERGRWYGGQWIESAQLPILADRRGRGCNYNSTKVNPMLNLDNVTLSTETEAQYVSLLE